MRFFVWFSTLVVDICENVISLFKPFVTLHNNDNILSLFQEIIIFDLEVTPTDYYVRPYAHLNS